MAKQQLTWTNGKRKLRDLAPWEHNPRQIKSAQAERLLESFTEFGQVLPICIDPANGILDGHQRRSVIGAADEYGLDYEVDVRVASRELTERERQKLTVYLHQGATGQWDWEELANSFNLDDLTAWGFDEDMLLGLDFANDEPAPADAEPQIDKAAELLAIWKVQPGDLWRIGEHRLVCGDCTDAATVAKVMGGEKADMVFTDPPYGVDYEGGTGSSAGAELKTKTRSKISNDSNCELYGVTFKLILEHMDHGPAYVWYADRFSKEVFAQLPSTIECRRVISWYKIKQGFGDMGSDYHCVTEPCLYLVKGKSRYSGANNEINVWELQRAQQNEFHPTQKPVELSMRAIRNHDVKIVADFFAGSGSTLVGAQNCGVSCRAIELSAAYCSIILQRMADAFPDLVIERI